MVSLYWNMGRVMATQVSDTGDYGGKVIRKISERLTQEYGTGFSPVNLWDMRRFFAAFRMVQTVSESSQGGRQLSARAPSAEIDTVQALSEVSEGRLEIDFARHFHLGWSHYRLLLAQSDPQRRRFYFEQAATQRWSTRELTRQVNGALFERVALSRNTRKLVATEQKSGPPETADYRDAFKDPYLLDFLGLTDAYSEKDLESAIIANLQQFLTELGNEFCFIRRQFPMRIDDDDYFLDLLFYHRGLRCLVAIDLKIGAFTASDKGQMDLYLAWLKRHEWRKAENEPVGLILCTSKKKQPGHHGDQEQSGVKRPDEARPVDKPEDQFAWFGWPHEQRGVFRRIGRLPLASCVASFPWSCG